MRLSGLGKQMQSLDCLLRSWRIDWTNSLIIGCPLGGPHCRAQIEPVAGAGVDAIGPEGQSRPPQEQKESTRRADQQERDRPRQIPPLAPGRAETSQCSDEEKDGDHGDEGSKQARVAQILARRHHRSPSTQDKIGQGRHEEDLKNQRCGNHAKLPPRG